MKARRRLMSEMNVVPYIDVMLVLLVIFMVASPYIEKGVEVNLPQQSAAPMKHQDHIRQLVLTVTQKGKLYLNLGDDEKGSLVTKKELLERASKIMRANPEVVVLLRADHTIEYGQVVGYMTLLQEAGIERVGLMTDPLSNS